MLCRERPNGVACCLEHFPDPPQRGEAGRKQRGRPKVEAELTKWDVRLTPEKPIDFERCFDNEDYEKVIICEEGGLGTDKKLHFHCYLESRRSNSYLYNTFAKICGGKGNKFYSMREAHDGTLGYAIKEEVVRFSKNFTEQEIEEIKERSRNYRKDKDADNKRASRAKEKYLATILKEVAEGGCLPTQPAPEDYIAQILKCYDRDTKRFPPRATLENAVMTLMYRSDPFYVIRYYTKNISV